MLKLAFSEFELKNLNIQYIIYELIGINMKWWIGDKYNGSWIWNKMHIYEPAFLRCK